MLTAPKRNPLNRDMDPISVLLWMIKTLSYTVTIPCSCPTILAKELERRKSKGTQEASCTCMLLDFASDLA